MINQGYGQMHPIYEAMSVCSGTLQWLNQQEQERSDWDMCTKLTKVGSAMQEFIDATNDATNKVATEGGSMNPPDKMRAFAIFCLCTLASMTRMINRSVRESLNERTDRLRPQIEFLVNQVDELTEKIEDIAEAWELSLDKALVAKIDVAVRQIDSCKTSIPEWREVLELISN